MPLNQTKPNWYIITNGENTERTQAVESDLLKRYERERERHVSKFDYVVRVCELFF